MGPNTITDVEAYARHKLALINQAEGTDHGDRYLDELMKEVEMEFEYADWCFEQAQKKAHAGCHRT